MRKLQSCGVVCVRDAWPRSAPLGRQTCRTVLLLRHPGRYDLPKGHREPGESELDCALRELEEETTISPARVRVDPAFRYSVTYYPSYRRFGGETVEKTVVLFLGFVPAETEVHTSEHDRFEWVPLPCHRKVQRTIDPILRAVETHLKMSTDR